MSLTKKTEMELASVITLSLSGILLIFVGLTRLSNPIKTYMKNSGIQLNEDPSTLNEMRGIASVMLLSGVILLLGVFVMKITFTSHMVGSIIFIGFVIGRLISLKADGKPGKQIIQGIMFEIVLGIANAICILIA